jgi:hypothetical protein
MQIPDRYSIINLSGSRICASQIFQDNAKSPIALQKTPLSMKK